MHHIGMDETRRQKAIPLMVFPNCRRMKDQERFACLILHQKKGNKASDAYNDVSDA
jgi:hypothetical protein